VASSNDPLELISFRGIRESFFVFSLFGAGLIIFGGIAFDLSKDLPGQYSKIVQEPLSINTSALLSMFGLVVMSLAALFRGEEAIRHAFIEKWVLAFSRAGLSAGAIVSGMLFGMGVALWFITLGEKDGELAINATQFIGLSLLILLFVIPVIILHLYLLYPWNKNILVLDVASVMYVISTVAGLIYVSNYLGWWTAGILFTILVMFAFLIKKLNKKIA